MHTCTCVITAGEDDTKLTVSKEQQQLLQQYQRMGRARDVQISQLQTGNELVQDKCKQLQTYCNLFLSI